jgi:soluble lytic murein transglycosylase-like protein
MGLLTPERLKKFDPKLQRKYMSIAQQQGKLSKENGSTTKLHLDEIENAVIGRVNLNKEQRNHPAVGLMVAEMQRRYQKAVTKLAAGGDENASQNAFREILGDFEREYAVNGEDIKTTNDVIELYKKTTLGANPPSNAEAKARFAGIAEALKDPNSVENGHLMTTAELEAAAKNYGKPGFTPGAVATFIGQQLGIDPLTVLNKQLELKGMDVLPPTPAMEIINNQTPLQKQLLLKYKSPQRSARGLAAEKYSPEIVPKGYGQMIQQSASKHGLPPSVIAGLIETESGWNPNAVSSAGARGLAQFMPATAAEFGVSPNNPQSAIDGAAKYLKYLVDYFKGDMRLAIFAYNGGMGNIERYGGPIPGSQENQEYYGKVMNGAYKYGYGKQSLQDPGLMRPSIAAQIPS